MAERSFKGELAKLRLGEGQEFRGEGILAVTKALLQSGVSYVSGYQGAPISHLVDVLADAHDVLQDLGIRFEASANEAAAAATLAASINYPLRGAATFKAPVGTNVASDALANLASSGVTGGALIIVGEDYGEGSSIMQERSHAFAMKSQIWLIDPRPNLPSIVAAAAAGRERPNDSLANSFVLVRGPVHRPLRRVPFGTRSPGGIRRCVFDLMDHLGPATVPPDLLLRRPGHRRCWSSCGRSHRQTPVPPSSNVGSLPP